MGDMRAMIEGHISQLQELLAARDVATKQLYELDERLVGILGGKLAGGARPTAAEPPTTPQARVQTRDFRGQIKKCRYGQEIMRLIRDREAFVGRRLFKGGPLSAEELLTRMQIGGDPVRCTSRNVEYACEVLTARGLLARAVHKGKNGYVLTTRPRKRLALDTAAPPHYWTEQEVLNQLAKSAETLPAMFEMHAGRSARSRGHLTALLIALEKKGSVRLDQTTYHYNTQE